jgi:copper ion binding protein
MGLFGSKNKTTMKVEGMTCNHCVMHVTKALEELDGVKSAKVNLDKAEAEVVFKGAPLDNNILVKAVKEAGYKAKPE